MLLVADVDGEEADELGGQGDDLTVVVSVGAELAEERLGEDLYRSVSGLEQIGRAGVLCSRGSGELGHREFSLGGPPRCCPVAAEAGPGCAPVVPRNAVQAGLGGRGDRARWSGRSVAEVRRVRAWVCEGRFAPRSEDSHRPQPEISGLSHKVTTLWNHEATAAGRRTDGPGW